HVRSASSLVPLLTLPDLLTRGSLLFYLARSSSQLALASSNLAGSAHPCEFAFLLSKFVEHARSCLLQPCLFGSPVRAYFSASEIRRAISLLPLATLPGLLIRASLLFCLASSPSRLARTSCNLAGSAHPCEFTFLLSKFAEPARSYLLQPCRVCSPARVYFSASQDRQGRSLLPLATMPGLLTRAILLFCFASSPSLLARASGSLAGCTHPCEFAFLLSKFVEHARSCLLQPCRVCSPQVRRASSLVPLATLPVLLTRASLLFFFGNSPSLLAPASSNLAGSAQPCEFTFLLSKFAEPARSCFLQPCRVCSPMRVYFSALQVRRASSLVLLATLPGLLSHASLLFCVASSPSQLARASCNLAGSALPCEFTFLRCKFAEPARSCFLQPCRVCSPMRVYFSALQVRRASSLVLLATLPGLLSHASLLFCVASSPSQLARASCNLAGSALPCEFTFLRCKFAEPARSCFLQPCRVCSPMRVYFSALQVRRASSLVLLATLPGLLSHASLLFCVASSPSQLARASCNLAMSALPCEFTFLLSKFAEPARSCFLQPCRFSSHVRAYFSTSEIRRAISLLPLATLPGLHTRAILLFCLASSPSQLAGASFNLAGSAHPCEFTFLRCKFAEPARSCLLQPCLFCSPQVRRASSLVPLTTLPILLTRASLLFCLASSPSQLARASYNLAYSAHPKFAEPARSCLLQPCRVCSPVRVYFSVSKVRRAYSFVPLATLPGVLTLSSLLFCLASSSSMLARASYNLVGSTHQCEFTFLLFKFAEAALSCHLQPCLFYSPVRDYFSTSEIRQAISLLPLATLPGLLTRSLLTRASCNLAGSAHPYEFTFLLRKFTKRYRSNVLQPCQVCSPVRV
ncbi:hypothetical protein CRG98_035672, partial [Punica granatum]